MKTSVLSFLKLKHSIKQPGRGSDWQSARHKRSKNRIQTDEHKKPTTFLLLRLFTHVFRNSEELTHANTMSENIYEKKHTFMPTNIRPFLPIPSRTGESLESIIIVITHVGVRTFTYIGYNLLRAAVTALERVQTGADGFLLGSIPPINECVLNAPDQSFENTFLFLQQQRRLFDVLFLSATRLRDSANTKSKNPSTYSKCGYKMYCK